MVTSKNLGKFLAAGRTSEVFAYGADSAVKVLRPDVPGAWADLEADLTATVGEQGLPAPQVRDLIEIEGRKAIVFERIDGPSMWQQLIAGERGVIELAAELAQVHRQIQQAGLPPGIPDMVARLRGKIDDATQLSAGDRTEAQDLVETLPLGAALLHGDLHPANVLIGQNGPVVIDWFDTSIGHPVADIVRSSILLRPSAGTSELPHLPLADRQQLSDFHDAYVGEFVDELRGDIGLLPIWEAVIAAGRLAEGAQPDESTLQALWSDRSSDVPSEMFRHVLDQQTEKSNGHELA